MKPFFGGLLFSVGILSVVSALDSNLSLARIITVSVISILVMKVGVAVANTD